MTEAEKIEDLTTAMPASSTKTQETQFLVNEALRSFDIGAPSKAGSLELSDWSSTAEMTTQTLTR